MEAATDSHAGTLEKNPKFAKVSEMLAMEMKRLHVEVIRPRLGVVEFCEALEGITESAMEVKRFGGRARKALGPDVSGRTPDTTLSALLAEFVRLTQDAGAKASQKIANPFEARELFNRHVSKLAAVSARGEDTSADAETETSAALASRLETAWSSSQLDLAIFMQAIMMMQQDPSLPLPPPPSLAGRRLPDVKDVVKMQKAMVGELEKVKDAVKEAMSTEAEAVEAVGGHVLVAFAQAIASAAVEEKFGYAAEDLTLAGFKHGPKLAGDRGFMEVTMKQQAVLGEIGEMGGEGPAGAGAEGGCTLM
jgi:hypothetical protein